MSLGEQRCPLEHPLAHWTGLRPECRHSEDALGAIWILSGAVLVFWAPTQPPVSVEASAPVRLDPMLSLTQASDLAQQQTLLMPPLGDNGGAALGIDRGATTLT